MKVETAIVKRTKR